jgi:hypothetical protein
MDGFVGFVVDWWVVLGVVVCPIVTALIPVVAELFLGFSQRSHHRQRSMDSIFCRTMVRLVMPTGVELSIWMGVRGWDQPILIRV